MKKNIVSQVAWNAPRYLFNKKPSQYVPFKGKFPIVENYQQTKWQKEFDETLWLEDGSEWFQETVAKARRMEAIEQGFIEFLRQANEYGDFLQLNASEKADLLAKYMDKNCLDIGALKIN